MTKDKSELQRWVLIIFVGAVTILFFATYEFYVRSVALVDARNSGKNDYFNIFSSTFHTDTHSENINKRLGIKLEYPDEGMFIKNHKIKSKFFNVRNKTKRSVTAVTNNLGLMSNKHYNIAKKEGIYRIVILGQEQTAPTTAPVPWPDHLWDILDADDKLKAFLEVNSIEVFNLGWPDARMYQYEFLIDKVKKFQPDLVLMNLAAHDFNPGIRSGFMKSKPNLNEKGISVGVQDFGKVDNPADMAFVSMACSNPPITLKNPNCIVGRPLGIFVGSNIMNNDKELLHIIDNVRNQYIDYAIQNTFLPLSILQWFLPDLDPETIRLIGYLKNKTKAPIGDTEKILIATQVLRKINKEFSELIVLRNPVKPEMLPNPSKFPFFTKLQAEIREIPLILMSEYLASGRSDKEIKELYYQEYDWKWTEKGHLEYAKSVSTMLKETVF